MADEQQPRWFEETPKITSVPVHTYLETWACPEKRCRGEMKFNGTTWSASTTGFHHTCDCCGFTAVLEGACYPRTVTR